MLPELLCVRVSGKNSSHAGPIPDGMSMRATQRGVRETAGKVGTMGFKELSWQKSEQKKGSKLGGRRKVRHGKSERGGECQGGGGGQCFFVCERTEDKLGSPEKKDC